MAKQVLDNHNAEGEDEESKGAFKQTKEPMKEAKVPLLSGADAV